MITPTGGTYQIGDKLPLQRGCVTEEIAESD